MPRLDGISAYTTTKGRRWQVVVKLKCPDGVWRPRRWKGFKSQREAIVWRDKVRAQRDQPRTTKETIRQTFEAYLAGIQHKKTWKEEYHFANWWLVQIGERTTTTNLTTDHLQRSQLVLKKRLANATVNRYCHWLRHCLNHAKSRDVITANLAAKLPTLPEPPAPTLYLTEDQEPKLQQSMGEYWPYARFAILTGMRRGEQFGMTWEQVNLKEGFIVLPTTKSGKPVIKLLTKEAITLLKRLPRSHARVFPGSVSGFQGKFRAWCKEAGLPKGFKWHTLRHTLGSRLGMAGASALEIGAILGHTQAHTAERYTHLGREHLRELLEKTTRKKRENWQLRGPRQETPEAAQPVDGRGLMRRV